MANGIAFPEMRSAIQPPQVSRRKTLLLKIKLESVRPFYQLIVWFQTVARERRLRARCHMVPFS